jgi:CRP/FNR family transcriptional regulator
MNAMTRAACATDGAVAQVARARHYSAGSDLFQQGFPAEEVVFLDDGIVKLIRLEDDGRQLIMGLRTAGSVLGVAPAVAERTHPATATTLTACTVRHLPASVFRQLLRSSHATSWQFQQMLSDEVCELAVRLSELACCASRQRLERALRAFVPRTGFEPGAEVKLQTPLKHREIAELIAVTPEQLSRLLKEMEADGLVRREKGWLILRDVRMSTRHAGPGRRSTPIPPPSQRLVTGHVDRRQARA